MDGDYTIISPWRRLKLQIPNPIAVTRHEILATDDLNMVIIDSGSVVSSLKTPLVGALIVPRGRESDQIFSTREGNIELLNSFFGVTRLFIISNQTSSGGEELSYTINRAENDRAIVLVAEETLQGLLLPYFPSVCHQQSVVPEVRFVTLKEKLIFRRVIEVNYGRQMSLGRFFHTDELIEINGIKSLRRRLRFSETHGWLHTEAILKPFSNGYYLVDDNAFYESLTPENVIEEGWIVAHDCFPEGRYSSAMVSSLYLVPQIFELNDQEENMKNRVLCLGIRDVLTPACLSVLGFAVVGIDNDPIIFDVLRRLEIAVSTPLEVGFHHYDDFLHELRVPGVKTGEEWDKMRKKEWGKTKFDAIFIDFIQPSPGIFPCSPPRGFLNQDTLMGALSVLRSHGIIVIHVVAPDCFFYWDTVKVLQDCVGKVYVANVNEKEFVLLAKRHEGEASTSGGDATEPMGGDAAEVMDHKLLTNLKKHSVPSFTFTQLV